MAIGAPIGAATARRVGTQLPPLQKKRKDLPPDLCAALDAALAPRPEDRGTLDELAALTSDLPELPDKPGPPVEPAGHARHLVLLFVIAFVTLAVLVGMMLLHP